MPNVAYTGRRHRRPRRRIFSRFGSSSSPSSSMLSSDIVKASHVIIARVSRMYGADVRARPPRSPRSARPRCASGCGRRRPSVALPPTPWRPATQRSRESRGRLPAPTGKGIVAPAASAAPSIASATRTPSDQVAERTEGREHPLPAPRFGSDLVGRRRLRCNNLPAEREPSHRHHLRRGRPGDRRCRPTSSLLEHRVCSDPFQPITRCDVTAEANGPRWPDRSCAQPFRGGARAGSRGVARR